MVEKITPFISYIHVACSPCSTYKKRERERERERVANLQFHLHIGNLKAFPTRAASSSSSSNNGAPPSINYSSSNNKGGPLILELPLEKIRRPLMRTRSNDPEKVKDLMDSISQIGLQVPIDVLEVDGAYYGFSGCHRYEAHQRLGLPTIRCKIRRGTKETLRHHLR